MINKSPIALGSLPQFSPEEASDMEGDDSGGLDCMRH